MKMRSILMAFTVVLSVSALAYAAFWKRDPVLPRFPVLECLRPMDSSPEQIEEVKAILEQHWEELRDDLVNIGFYASRNEIQAVLESHRESVRSDIKEILSQEQLSRIESVRRDLENGVCPRFLVERLVDRFAGVLDLEQDQCEKLAGLATETGNRLLVLKENSASVREFLLPARHILQDADARWMDCISDEQKLVYHEWKEECRGLIREGFARRSEELLDTRVSQLSFLLDLRNDQRQELEWILTDARRNILEGIELFPDGGMLIDHLYRVDQRIQSILDADQLERFTWIKSIMEKRLGL